MNPDFHKLCGKIVQLAFVVDDINLAMQDWIDDNKVGPWFLLDSFCHPQQLYRGQPTSADVSIAMAYSGHMMIELIQPKDTHPSVYRETMGKRGCGFHHIGIAVHDAEAECAAYEERGYQVAFQTPVPSGGKVYYMDKPDTVADFIELIPVTPGMVDKFTRFWRASVDWQGESPIRPFH